MKTTAQIAESLNLTSSAIERRAKKLGVTPRGKEGHSYVWTEAQARRITEGPKPRSTVWLSALDLAEKYGGNRATWQARLTSASYRRERWKPLRFRRNPLSVHRDDAHQFATTARKPGRPRQA